METGGKQILVYPNFSNKEKQIIDKCDTVDKCQDYHSGWKKPEHQRIYTIWFHLYKILDNCLGFFVKNDKKQTGGCLKKGERWRWNESQMDMSDFGGKIVIFVFLTTVMVSQVYAHVTTDQTVHFKYAAYCKSVILQ